MKRQAGLTLIEVMVVVALIGVVLTLAAPAFKDMILMQRLRGISSELVTDMQLARSEAVARRNFVRVHFQSDASSTCYVVYVADVLNPTSRCNCLAAPTSVCPSGFTEVKTVVVPKSRGVRVDAVDPGLPGWEPSFSFDWRTGGIYANPTDTEPAAIPDFFIDSFIDAARKLSTRLNAAGRPTVCRPSGSTMSEAPCSPS